MREKDREETRLFESAKNSAPEINLHRIQEMVYGFSEISEPPTVNNNWTKFINLKNGLIMFLISSTLILLFVNFNTPVDSLALIESSTENITNSIFLDSVANQTSASSSKTDDTTVNYLDKEEPASHLIEKNKFIMVQEIESKSITLDSQEKERLIKTPNFDIQQINNESKILNSPHENLEKEKSTLDSSGGYAYITSNESGLTTKPISMGNLKLRRLKKILYKNLEADKLIKAKYANVIIDLPGSKILVNGKKIDDLQFKKYQDITIDVGIGKYRKIKMNRDNIRVGDFTEDGFTGEGFGKFFEKIESPYKPISINDKEGNELFVFEKEDADLKALSDRLFGPFYGGSAPFRFHINLKFEEMLELHQTLYPMVIRDGFIESKKFPVIIELDKIGIKINGQVLSGKQLDEYQAIVKKYKIKPAPFRSIRLTEHQIKVGDFGDGNFSGTSTTIGEY